MILKKNLRKIRFYTKLGKELGKKKIENMREILSEETQ